MAAFKYEFAGTMCRHKVSAQDVGETCEMLEKSEQGLSPKTLLDVSRDENHPLHKEFEWDDTVAAEKWRLEQARQLIVQVRVIQSNSEEETAKAKERGFVSTPGRTGAYVTLDTALHQENLRKYLLDQAKRDSQIFVAKYRRMEELAAVVSAMEAFIEQAG